MFKTNVFSKNVLSKFSCVYFSNHASNISVSNVFKTKKVGDKVKIQGWVKSLRKMKENVFFDISDGSCDKKLQVIIPNTLKPYNLAAETSITASGALTLSPKGNLELTAEKLDVCGACNVAEGYPFLPRKTYPPDYVRQYLHLRPRTNKFSSLLRVRDATTLAIHEHLHSEGYISIHTPVLTSNDCEGAGEVFTVHPDNKNVLKSMKKPDMPEEEGYFDTKVFLTVSGQLHLEAIAHGLSKVYTFGPTFRAENSKSRLHLSEFYMLEVETAFVNNLESVVETIESLVKNVARVVQERCASDLSNCNPEGERDLSWIDKKFGVITFEEAASIIRKHQGHVSEKEGFSKEDEVFIVEHCGGVPTFVVDWPKHMKPFYMRESATSPDKVAALDLLAPSVGEIVGGSLRENDYQKLQEKIPNGNNKLDWYLDLRKYGGVPTGGFGMGFERFLQLILGVNNIKDCIPFPRWPHNCSL